MMVVNWISLFFCLSILLTLENACFSFFNTFVHIKHFFIITFLFNCITAFFVSFFVYTNEYIIYFIIIFYISMSLFYLLYISMNKKRVACKIFTVVLFIISGTLIINTINFMTLMRGDNLILPNVFSSLDGDKYLNVLKKSNVEYYIGLTSLISLFWGFLYQILIIVHKSKIERSLKND